MRALLPRELARRLENQAPSHWRVPSGAQRPIVYGEEGGPWLAAKLQELFGCEETPRIADNRVPLTLRLNSPAGRPLQVTRDLAAFLAQRLSRRARGNAPDDIHGTLAGRSSYGFSHRVDQEKSGGQGQALTLLPRAARGHADRCGNQTEGNKSPLPCCL